MLVCAAAAPTAKGQTYDAFSDFSITQNPNGVWSYGWSSTLAGPITIYTGTYTNGGTYTWTDDTILDAGDPNIGYVPVGDTETGLPAGTLGIAPGPENQFSHCIFTATTSGTYEVQYSFTATSYGLPKAYILNNGSVLGSSYLTNGVAWSGSFTSVTLAAGDTLAAVMGVGTDNSFIDDEEYFSFTVTLTGTSAPPPPPPPPPNGVHDAFADFSTTQNPNGVWTYGWSGNLAGPVTIYTGSYTNAGTYTWTDDSILFAGDPNVGYVPVGDTETGLPAGTLGIAPGPGNQFSHCIFTATTPGTYEVQYSFTATSYGVPKAYILNNGSVLASNYLTHGVAWSGSLTSLTLAAGDTLDAVMGVGTDNSFIDDAEFFSFTVTLTGTSAPPPPPPPPPPPANGVYDAFAQFSTTQNPNAWWTYGWSANLAGPITIYTGSYTNAGTYTWTDDSILEAGDPNVGYVPVGDTETGLPAGTLGIAPGPGNQFSHCQFTVPVAGVYQIQASFTPTSNGAPVAYVLHNGAVIGQGVLNPGATWAESFTPVSLSAGDTVDAVIGVGSDKSFIDDEEFFSFTITDLGASPPGPFVPGSYAGLLSGTESAALDGIGGILAAKVRPGGDFAADLDLGGQSASFNGQLSGSNSYSTVVHPKKGPNLNVTLGFDAAGLLTGSVSGSNGSYLVFASQDIRAGAARGIYPFTVTTLPNGTGDVPEGTGIGTMTVDSNGQVAISGHLGDGTRFAASSQVTSRTSIPIYANLYGSPTGGLAGILEFQNTQSGEEFAGMLQWSRPPSSGSAPYSGGFETSVELKGDRLGTGIGGLNGDQVSFDASGGDLGTDLMATITLQSIPAPIPLYSGKASNISLLVLPTADIFAGSFKDPTTNKVQTFSGVLTPGSRTGSGTFFAKGVSGTVTIQY
ncbi:MAG: hypothetical protein ABSE62_14010 [Chthoniobacteraceae bacterium]